MKNLESKKTWKTPKLIVLGRGKPEELVLLGCKHPAVPAGPGKAFNECKNPDNKICMNQSFRS